MLSSKIFATMGKEGCLMDAAALETNIYAAVPKKDETHTKEKTEPVCPKREPLSRWSRFLCNEQ